MDIKFAMDIIKDIEKEGQLLFPSGYVTND